MKNIIMMLASAVALTACVAPAEKPMDSTVQAANPASQYCVEQGGCLEIKKDEQGGEYGLCHLPDGQVVEEWALFRSKQ